MSSDADHCKEYLPPNKQYLVCKRVVCSHSSQSMKDDDTMDGEWLVTEEQKKQDNECEEEIIVAPASESISIEKNKAIVNTTYYDVSIVYDPYYQTPHVYFCGYRDDGMYLSSEDMMKDVDEDYVLRTVTLDPHPFGLVDHTCLSVHPCMHASTMSHMISTMEENGNTMRPDQYLFLFLKFLMSVVPNIHFDYTTEVQV
ncbi:hypothetical protein WA171_000907, partial [Blastocystis sp. BT1]